MSIYDQLSNNNMQSMLTQLKANPASVLRQRGLNIPAGMNNPQEIIQHLVTSGQVSNPRLQQIMSLIRR